MGPLLGVLSGYTLEPIDPFQTPTVRGLVEGLARCGRKLGEDYRLAVSHSNSLEVHEAAVRKWLAEGVDLIFSGGTPACGVLRKVLAEAGQRRPVVYWGAHPIDGSHEVAREDCLLDDTACVRIELPLTYNHRNFRILRRLFPEFSTVHIAFARTTVFCHREMAARYDRLTRERGPHAWARGDEVGFGSLRDLAWIIDADYREHPLRSAADLRAALGAIPARSPSEPIRDVMVAFNDTFHVEGAPRVLLEHSERSNVPLVWVNNRSMPSHGAAADFCNPFERVSEHAARYVDEFLSGRWVPGRRTIEWDHDTHFTLNRGRLTRLGAPAEAVGAASRFFQEILE
jgi:hypothetical protein